MMCWSYTKVSKNLKCIFYLQILVLVILIALLLEKLISWNNNLLSYEQRSIAVTFTTQLKQLNRESYDCSNLLKVLSFFDLESIPLNMVTDRVGGLRLCFVSHSILSNNTPKQKSMQSIHQKLQRKLQFQSRKLTNIINGLAHELNNTSLMTLELDSLITLMSSPVQLPAPTTAISGWVHTHRRHFHFVYS